MSTSVDFSEFIDQWSQWQQAKQTAEQAAAAASAIAGQQQGTPWQLYAVLAMVIAAGVLLTAGLAAFIRGKPPVKLLFAVFALALGACIISWLPEGAPATNAEPVRAPAATPLTLRQSIESAYGLTSVRGADDGMEARLRLDAGPADLDDSGYPFPQAGRYPIVYDRGDGKGEREGAIVVSGESIQIADSRNNPLAALTGTAPWNPDAAPSAAQRDA